MERSLDTQRADYSRRRLMAMPLAGTVAWAVVAAAGLVLDTFGSAMVLFAATGSIVYLGIALSKLTGEDFLDKTRPKNAFDALFMHTVAMSLGVYAIAIPFFMQDASSLPLTVGILTGLMWLPLSWVIRHPVGLWHAGVRTAGVLAAWLAFPEQRFVAVPLVIVAVYAVTLWVLQRRWQALQRSGAAAASARIAAASA
jgi:NADPH:quinone reductase-like Zn-dependent oxidoreductase